MADRSPIEWTDATWNPIRGCTRVSEGCRNCYAEVMAARFSDPGQWAHGLAQRVSLPGGGIDHRWTGKLQLIDSALDLPLRWRKPRRIFVNSTSDLFHEAVPDEWIDQVFAVMAMAPQHTFQVLTKRPERMHAYLTSRMSLIVRDCEEVPCGDGMVSRRIVGPHRAAWPLPNVWLGTSVEDQATADARIPHLLATPAAVRFISAEPLLGPVKLSWINTSLSGDMVNALTGVSVFDKCDERGKIDVGVSDGPRLDWIIVGGESGPGARPMHPDWARSLRDQCVAAGVPFFFKQWGEWLPLPEMCDWGRNWMLLHKSGVLDLPDHRAPDYEKGELAVRAAGKKATGRILDGCIWNQIPGGAHA